MGSKFNSRQVFHISYFILYGIFFTSSLLYGQHLKDIPFTKYHLVQQQCYSLLYKSGSRINVPENAFVTSDGKVCSSEIIIKYRELHNQLDMIVSGISMDFEDEKGKHTLESGGMFEIYAECGGKSLKLAKNKKIQVRFAVYENIEGLDVFIFDKDSKKWRKINNPVTDFGAQTENNKGRDLWGTPSVPPFGLFDNDEWNEEGNWEEYIEKETQIFKSMDIDQMGLYNYDRILKEDDRIPILANFKLKNIEGVINKIYVVYEGINSVLYYYKNDWKETFALLPRSDYKIFAIGSDGRVALLTETDKKKIDLKQLKNKSYTFELELQQNVPHTRTELATITGLN